MKIGIKMFDKYVAMIRTAITEKGHELEKDFIKRAAPPPHIVAVAKKLDIAKKAYEKVQKEYEAIVEKYDAQADNIKLLPDHTLYCSRTWTYRAGRSCFIEPTCVDKLQLAGAKINAGKSKAYQKLIELYQDVEQRLLLADSPDIIARMMEELKEL